MVLSFRPRWADLPAVVAVAVLLWSLSTIWYQWQDCPLFDPCGPWEPRSGWHIIGPTVLGAVVVAGVPYILMPWTVARRAVPAGVLVATAGLVYWGGQPFIVIFGNVKGPFTGYYVATVAAGVAGVALAASAALAWRAEQSHDVDPVALE